MTRYYQIEENAPIPTNRVRKYPFANMKVGSAFSVPRSEDHRVRSAASYWSRNHGVKFTIARMPDGKTKCWRIK